MELRRSDVDHDAGEVGVTGLWGIRDLGFLQKVGKTLFVHPLFKRADWLSSNIIGAAIEVHRDKGPGLNETIYEWCLLGELELRRLATENQRTVPIRYKGFERMNPFDSMYWWKNAFS
jgi:hypothetical protein